mgnify:CR=1 FL=1
MIEEKLKEIFKEVTGREPTKEELERIYGIFEDERIKLEGLGWGKKEAEETALEIVRKVLEIRYA